MIFEKQLHQLECKCLATCAKYNEGILVIFDFIVNKIGDILLVAHSRNVYASWSTLRTWCHFTGRERFYDDL